MPEGLRAETEQTRFRRSVVPSSRRSVVRSGPIMRSGWARRLLAHARSAHALDDPWGVAACAIELEALARGDDWVASAIAGGRDAAPVRAAGIEALGQFERICVVAVRWAAERRAVERDDAAHELAGSVARLLAIDPVVDLARPRYRWRLPWLGASRAAFRDLLAPIFAQVVERDAIVPDGAAALARCEAIANGLGADAPDAGDPEPSRAAIRRTCDELIARDAVWPEPLRSAHAHALRAAVERAATPYDVDGITVHAWACFAIEAAWWRTLVATVGAPRRAARLATNDPGIDVAAARDLARAMTGEADPLRLPWLAAFVERNLAPNQPNIGPEQLGSAEATPIGAYLGEAGFELLSPYRVAHRHDLRALTRVDEARAPVAIHLWDREVGLDDADQLRATGISGRPSP